MLRRRCCIVPRLLLLAVGVAGAPHEYAQAEDANVQGIVTDPGHGAPESSREYLAASLDDQGMLSEALPLYQQRAARTRTLADRLRYASALLRTGRTDDGRAIYDQIAAEKPEGAAEATYPAVCASRLLTNGSPVLAAVYARAVFRETPNDPRVGLLLVRALFAAGDAAGARTALAKVSKLPKRGGVGQRLELARWQMIGGDKNAAQRLLRAKVDESVGQMLRDSILANAPFQQGDWAKATDMLEAAERKVPKGLHEARVARAWRNVQREIRWVELRRAISLWKQEKREWALSEATKAQASDEEYVRSAATLLLAASDLAQGARADAFAKLDVLAGHDPRFADSLAALKAAVGAGSDYRSAIGQLKATLTNEDRSADFVSQPLFDILSGVSGRIVEAGIPDEVLERPRTAATRALLGLE